MSNLISITPKDPARVAATTKDASANLASLFHPVEHAILRKFFRMRARKSDPVDLSQRPKPGFGEPPGYIGIDTELSEFQLENAVARICLGAIQERLPQWGCLRDDGTLALNRKGYTRREHAVETKPVFLFEINWADSGPGFSWPVAYWATFIPGYARWVVTGSADGPDVWGCADIALGHFRGQDIRAGAGQVLRRDWRRAYKEYDQSPWAYLFGEGLVSAKDANAWRQRVWRGHEELRMKKR